MHAAGPMQIKKLMNVDCLNAELNSNLQQLASQNFYILLVPHEMPKRTPMHASNVFYAFDFDFYT
jgi:hypothetical protein